MNESSYYHNKNFIVKKPIIYYLSIGDLLNRKIIIDYLPQGKSMQHTFKKKARETIDKLILINIQSHERDKETFDNDNKKILSIADGSKRIAFMCIISETYPDRFGYKLIEELEIKSMDIIKRYYFQLLNNNADLYKVEDEFKSYAKDIQLYMVELERNFREVNKFDTILKIENDVDEIKNDMKSNINKMITNIELVSTLENRSQELKDKAKDFKMTSKDFKKETGWTKKKYKVLAGGIGFGTLGFLLFKLIKSII